MAYPTDLSALTNPTAGSVEEATTAETNAGTASGTVAKLFVTPAKLAASIFGLQLPTSDEKDALAGTGTPASGNKFVTQDTLDAIQKDSQTAGATISGATTPVACYMDNSDDEWYACDANDQAKLEFQGFAITNGTDGAEMDIQFEGIVSGFTGLTKGAKYYVSDTSTITTTIGTYEVYVGIALSTTEILIDKGNNASMQYMGSSAFSVSTTNTDYAEPTGARMAVVDWGVNADSELRRGSNIFLSKKGATSQVITYTGSNASDDFVYTITWTGANINITETSDEVGTNTTISGTIYWYR